MIEIPIADYNFSPPPGAIQVSIDGGEGVVRIYFEEDGLTTPAPDLAALKQQKNDLFYALAAAEIDQVTGDYSSREVSTFLLKEGEAIAYLASDPRNPALAPWLAELAAGRGMALEAIAQLVVSRAPAIRSGMVQVEIKRGLYCDAVAAAATVEEVEAIAWDLPLPAPPPEPEPEPLPEP